MRKYSIVSSYTLDHEIKLPLDTEEKAVHPVVIQ